GRRPLRRAGLGCRPPRCGKTCHFRRHPAQTRPIEQGGVRAGPAAPGHRLRDAAGALKAVSHGLGHGQAPSRTVRRDGLSRGAGGAGHPLGCPAVGRGRRLGRHDPRPAVSAGPPAGSGPGRSAGPPGHAVLPAVHRCVVGHGGGCAGGGAPGGAGLDADLPEPLVRGITGRNGQDDVCGGYGVETKRTFAFGLEARLFALIFVVAAAISAFITLNTYNREKQQAERALGDELVRMARTLAAVLDPEHVARLPHEAPDSPLAREYSAWAQRLADATGVANVYTCSPAGPGQCLFGIINEGVGIPVGTLYNYAETEAGDSWRAALAGQPAASSIYRDDYGEWMNGVA